MMDQNDATNVSGASVDRAIGGIGGDITTYLTMGGSILVSRMSGAAMKVGVRQALTKIMSVTAADAALGATVNAASSIGEQSIEAAAGERGELDTEQVATQAAVGAGAAIVLGVGSAVAADPALRQFAKKTTSKALSNMTSTSSPHPRGPKSQRGVIGVERTPKQVEFRSKLNDEIEKENAKVSQ